MTNGKDSPLSSEQVHQQVDLVMDRWQSYPSFAALLQDLIDANGISSVELARQLTRLVGRSVGITTMREYCLGERHPPYVFIEELLATNALHLDPYRIQPAENERPVGDQRIALFAAAGLIEVTPDSIRQWNQEVLASHRRLMETNVTAPRPHWGDLMTKLLSFHRQGHRQILPNIASGLRLPEEKPCTSTRLYSLLDNDVIPSESERLALYRYTGLDESQIAYIEEGIASGTIPIRMGKRRNQFADALNPILNRLASQGITLKQLTLLSAQPPLPGATPVCQPDLSGWRHGRSKLTLEKLRSLVASLQRVGPYNLSDTVTDKEIASLILAAGFHAHDLTDTTHGIIARIDDQTRIKPLLRALQSAVDTSLPADEIYRRGIELGCTAPSISVLNELGRPDGTTYPTKQQVRDLLILLNHIIRQNGFPPLSDEEISTVIEVAERDHASWQSLSHAEKLTERKPRARRQTPSPSFDDIMRGG